MMERNLQAQFDSVCQRVIEASAKPAGEDELEPVYEEFLNFLIKNQDKKDDLIRALIGVIAGYRDARTSGRRLLPVTAIAYSMHELRWPEIYAFAESENKDFYSKKKATMMWDVMEAYSNDWQEREFYERFS